MEEKGMTEAERLKVLRDDIGDLRGKLLRVATEPVSSEMFSGENVAENERKARERLIRDRLKDRMTTYALLKGAEEICGI